MKQFLKNNLLFISHFLFSVILELSTLFILTNSIFIKEPWILLLISLSVFAIYNLISNIKAKSITLFVIFFIQIILNLFCVILFENTGSMFDFSMLQLVGETTKSIKTISLNYWYIAYICLLLVVYVLDLYHLSKYIDKHFRFNYQKLVCSLLLTSTLIGQVVVSIFTNNISEERFINSLYKDTNDKYKIYGNSGNFINELEKMFFFNNYNKLSHEEIEEYIYNQTNSPTSKFGISEGNNLITILVESFEWFSFISDTSVYPNGLNLNEETLDSLFPNLREFYNSSVVMNNHYSQNKTDISEDEALLGSYPSSAYVNYGFPNTDLPFSLANSLKLQNNNLTSSFFHSNEGSFYNRSLVAQSLGFENLYFIDEMCENGVTNYIEKGLGYSEGMNLDSDAVMHMKDYMFPVDKRFNTHFTTISMHGNYITRPNMKQWISKMESLSIVIENDYLKNYIAAVMEFDNALGLIIEDLKNKGLLDKTTIVLFSDHNSYLSELTYQVKDIKINNFTTDNYIELYRVPLMIYDSNIPHEIINKFTTTYDIVPTILDLFGINYFTSLYYGNSIFSEEESILYSKAFDIFIADGLLYSNIKSPLYAKKGITEEYINGVEEKSLALLKKIYFINHIFNYNYFKDISNYDTYITKINSINKFHK